MREQLYLTLRKFSLRFAYFMFFDTKPYLGDQLFVQKKVRVWFDQEYEKADSPYLAILCHVRKRDVQLFFEALEELKKSMAICGHPSYETEINQIIDEMKAQKGKTFENQNDAPEEAK